MKPLTVFRASAGSGKTFTLATQYISLVIQNPTSYRNILAVTFTNKATEEMKMRILSKLYGIANGLADSEDYLNVVMEKTHLSRVEVKKRAKMALSNLLHNFNDFKVETIDAFFQTVLRNLAHELDLTANLRIGLNDTQVMEQAVDDMIEELDDKSRVMFWIIEYIQEKIKDDQNWNVIGQIKRFGKNIFKDAYKQHAEELEELMLDKDFFKDFIGEMRKTRKNALDKLTEMGNMFFEKLEENGLAMENFKGKDRGIASYFNKLRRGEFLDEQKLVNATVKKCLDAPENWVNKKDANPGNAAYDLVVNTLWELLKSIENKRPKWVRDYKSAELTIKNLNQLRLLGDIKRRVRLSNNEANRFLLSDTQTLLYSLIEESDSPFIFEKIGARLEHIMIDEFQDTSVIQWKNFKVLLEETMSHGSDEENLKEDGPIRNLIVGDVKQSIYRWRSGDWRLLNGIENQFHKNMIEAKSLETNFRSERNIIEFNNAFFSVASSLEYNNLTRIDNRKAEELRKAYEDVKQLIPENRKNIGRVEVRLLPKNEDYREETLAEIVARVSWLIELGAKEKDIAILVRGNKEIEEIGNYFMRYHPSMKLVSDEAFRLDASQAVNIIIDALHLIIHPDDRLAKASLVKTYQKLIVGDEKSDTQILVAQEKKADTTLDWTEQRSLAEKQKEENLDRQLPEAFIHHLDKLKGMPLVDLVEYIYELFELKKLEQQSAYVCAFYDALNDYQQEQTPDIDHFLREWENTIHEKTIQSDDVNGVRILTIHKSKGLEFDHVIVPFCDWDITGRDTLWCSPEEEPYSKMPLVPIDFSRPKMMGSVYEKDYVEESIQSVVDNMNLLYVAFTRAGKNLFVYGMRGDTDSHRDFIIEESLECVRDMLPDSKLKGLEGDAKEEVLAFSYGPLAFSDEVDKENTENVFELPVKKRYVNIQSFKNIVDFRQSNKSTEFVESEDEEAIQRMNYIHEGNVMHTIFSTINTIDDVDRVLSEMETEGILYDDSIDPVKLRTDLKKKFDNPIVKDWFSGRWKLFNECTILHIDPVSNELVERRPDRVMTDGDELVVVDFKFGKMHPEYFDQVRMYMYLLQKMGHKNVKGYLWFVKNNKIEEVK